MDRSRHDGGIARQYGAPARDHGRFFQRPDPPRLSSGPAAGLPPAHQAIRPAGREHAWPGHPRRITMKIVVVVVIPLFLLGMALSARIVKQYEPGVVLGPTCRRLGVGRARRVSAAAEPAAALPPTGGPGAR